MNDPVSAPGAREINHPPRRLVGWMSALTTWLLVPWWIILGTTREGELLFWVCVAFATIGFGIAGLCVQRSLDAHAHPRRDRRGNVPSAEFQTHAGPLPMRHAWVQFLLVPAAIAVGFTALAIVKAAVEVAS